MGDAPDTRPLYEQWSLHDADLYADEALTPLSAYYGPDAAEIRACLDHAAATVDVDASDGRGRVVPLHREDDPEPSGEFVRWNPDAGTVGWHDESFGISGTDRYTELDDVLATVVAWRVRFWHPEYAPDADPFSGLDAPPESVPAQAPLKGRERRELVDELRDTVASERAAERDQNWHNHAAADLGQLIGERSVDGPFVLVSTTARSDRPADVKVQYAPEEGTRADVDLVAEFDLYPENYVVLDAFHDALPIPARIAAIDGPVLTLQPEWHRVDDPERAADALEEPDSFWVRELLNPVPYDRRRDALDAVWDADAKRRLLTGERDLSFGALPGRRRSDLALNDYQLAALGRAVAADDVVCVHGPPGTGKTRTLAAFVSHAVARGERVLVTAHSNQAVDNLLVGDSTSSEADDGSIHGVLGADEDATDSGDDPDAAGATILRYGRHSRNRVVREQYRDAAIGNADVVAATTNGAATFDQDAFDVAVVDEATQASRAATVIVLNCAEKLVLAGDHRQLPPYSVTEAGDGEMRPSLFETLVDRYGDAITVLLARQYRMHEAIARFPNEAFYDGRLETASRNADWTIDGLPAVSVFDVAGDEHREERGASVRNPAEARVVADRVERVLDAGVAPADVGVIAAYTGQVSEIRGALGDRGVDTQGLTVDTVDSFQGGERDAIVVSFARSNPGANAGFLEHPQEGPRRLNVALTRARKHLALVGDWDTLTERATHREPRESCADVYAALYDELRGLDAVEHHSRNQA